SSPLFSAHAVVAPGGERGVLAARLSTRQLDDVMTGGGSWLREGLGESGETYLVGPDLLMRSDSRFQIETPDAYYRQLRDLGYSPSSLERLRSSGTSVLLQAVDTAAARQALAGRAATRQVADYRGIQVLSSYTPLALPGLGWAMLSEIDVEEAFRPVRALRLQLAALALLISGAFALVGYLIARGTTRPLLALTAEVERLGRGGRIRAQSAKAFRRADDEIARLWQTFENLTERLSATLVSRDHLDSVLASMINAVFVLRDVGQGASGGPVVASANPAACRLLGYSAQELRGLPLRAIIGSSTDEPAWMAQLRRDGSLPAIEKELAAAGRRRIPVLFTTALVDAPAGTGREAVCVAQDITERKAAEERLRASRQDLRVLAGRLLKAQEEERSRLARELHDDIAQRLAMLAIDAGKLAQGTRPGEQGRQALGALKELIVTLSDDVQNLSRRLHPAMLDDLGLPAALRAECRSLSKRLGIPVSFAAEDPPAGFPRESSLALYRIAQESFRNIAAHAGASEVSAELGVVDGNVRLSIEDDGSGFDREQARRRGGLGLASLDERARLVGGRIAIRTAPGQGVRIVAEVPQKSPA
ncbi:MAG: PAS domain S-box protein, partial [Bryobacterales bacterium]|nr:PAS domain S-box protein [Bryobacterales bacterium]